MRTGKQIRTIDLRQLQALLDEKVAVLTGDTHGTKTYTIHPERVPSGRFMGATPATVQPNENPNR